MDGNLLFQALKEEQCCVCWSQRPSASLVEHRVGSDQLCWQCCKIDLLRSRFDWLLMDTVN